MKRILRLFCLIIALLVHTACTDSSNKNSIPLTNLEVLYEKNAGIDKSLQKEIWDEIICPQDIERYDPAKDPDKCICMKQRGWEAITDFNDLNLDEPSPKNVNYFWVRGSFNIDDSPEGYTGIYLEYLQGRDLVYINNSLVAIKSANSLGSLQRPSRYMIPAGLLVKGENTVFMRLEILSSEGRGISPNLFIQSWTEYTKTAFRDRVRYGWLRNVSFFIICVFFLYFTIYSFKEENRKLYVLSSLFLLFDIIVCVSTVVSFTFIDIGLYFRLLTLTPYFFGIFLARYFPLVYGVILYREKYIFTPIILLYGMGFVFFSNNLNTTEQGLVHIPGMVFGIFAMFYILYQVNRRKRDRIKLYLLSFILILGITCIIGEIVTKKIRIPWWPYYPYDFLAPFFLLIISVYTIFFNIREKKKERIHFEKLYGKFIVQTNRPSPAVTVTDSSEEKLERVIEFINENYTEDISREGLAAAVDMNPNYLSTLFNVYTGKKFYEYINELRIEKAAQLIKDTEKNIVDIAFSVGFLNQATFIRTFKKEMGETPRVYRKQQSTI